MSGIIKYNFPDDVQKIYDLPQRILQAGHDALRTQAELMKGLAQIYVLVDTGSLRDSIRIEEVPTKDQDFARSIRVRAGGYVTNPKTGKLVDYAAYIEAKSPFMAPAWADVKGQVLDALENLEAQRST
jgi:hypothetical protein